MITSVPCPNCRRPWPLTEQTLGRAVTCGCGHTFKLPSAVPVIPLEPAAAPTPAPKPAPLREDFFAAQSREAPDVGDTIPLADLPDDEVPLSEIIPVDDPDVRPIPKGDFEGFTDPRDPMDLAPAPVIPVQPGRRQTAFPGALGYQSRRPVGVDRQTALLLGSPWRDFYVPLALVCIGAILYYTRNILYDPSQWRRGVVEASAQMILNGVVTTVVVLLLGRLTDMDFGTATGTILKTAAVAVFPNAVAGLFLLGGGYLLVALVGGICAILLNYTLFKLLFDLELAPAFLCTVVTTVFTVLTWGAIWYFF